MNSVKLAGLLAGIILFLLMLNLQAPGEMSHQAWRVAAVATLMAIWWVSEAVPLPATALIPIVLFPLLGVMSTADTTLSYANHLIYLFLSGFLIAKAMERWGLHKRMALHIITLIGTTPRRIILGFMGATALLSMWISNTATALMMLPIAMAVLEQLEPAGNELVGRENGYRSTPVSVALMLGIAYGASIGGVATLIGTPPNAILAGMAEKLYGYTISFSDWLSFGLPLSLSMLIITGIYLTRFVYKSVEGEEEQAMAGVIARETAGLGKMSRAEWMVLTVFLTVATLWIVRGLVELPLLHLVSDASIGMAGAVMLFILPVNIRKGIFLLDWQTANRIPWEILILFGGGFALAEGFSGSGLTHWLVSQLELIGLAQSILLVLAVTTLVLFLTEVTSNTATATMAIPIMGALAVAVDKPPLMLMIPAAIAASYAFMLPVATPPNAIVFASRGVTIRQMVVAGFWLNVISIILITTFVIFLLPYLPLY